jgi:aspartate kinase
MFGTLAGSSINIAIISTSDIRITCVIPRDRAEDAMRILHDAFELDRED